VTLFDLLFIVLFFATAFSLVAAVLFALRHQLPRAGRILRRILFCAAVYFAIVVAVSLISHRRTMKPGKRHCFDDMCVSVSGYQRIPEGTAMNYRVEMELFNRGRGVSQRENNLVAYLTDNQGRRYDPIPDKTYVAFNVLLRPNEWAMVSRSFLIPQSAKGVGAVITHEGGFPIGWFIIDYDTWFRKPPLVPLS
jgi:hypothetical protein